MISEAEKEINDAHYASAPELVRKFCPTRIMDRYSWDILDELLDVQVHRLIPQAVELIRTRVPAFAHAAPGDLSTKMALGLETTSGFEAMMQLNPSSRTNISLRLIVSINFWLKNLEDGSQTLSREEQVVSTGGEVIIHEMVHAFMCDYNRRSMATSFTVDMADGELVYYTEDSEAISREELNAKQAAELFPEWFMEGSANLLAGCYPFQQERMAV